MVSGGVEDCGEVDLEYHKGEYGEIDLEYRYYSKNSGEMERLLGPGGLSHPHLQGDRWADVRGYGSDFTPIEQIHPTGNPSYHFGGTCPLSDSHGGVDPQTLLIKGTVNVHVVDGSLIPAPTGSHPSATIMAIAEKASDILNKQLSGSGG